MVLNFLINSLSFHHNIQRKHRQEFLIFHSGAFRPANTNLTEHDRKIPPTPPLSSTCHSSNPTCTPPGLHQSFCTQSLTASPPMLSCKLCGESQLAICLLSAIWIPAVPPPHPHDTCISPCHHRPRRSSGTCWLPGNPPLHCPTASWQNPRLLPCISGQYPPMTWNLPRWKNPLHSTRSLAMSGSGPTHPLPRHTPTHAAIRPASK